MSTGKPLPIWSLSPQEEKKAYTNWRNSAYKHCDDVVKEFTTCSKQAGVKVTVQCKDLHHKMYECVEKYQTLENLDLEYDKIIAEKMAKQRK